MPVVNQNGTRADLGEATKTGLHGPEPADALSKDSHEGHGHDDEHNDHEHGFELVKILPVATTTLRE